MIHPQFDRAAALAREFNVIPICQTFLADTETPIGLYQKCRKHDYAFLLESVEGATKWARYSFIGSQPFMTFIAKDGKTTIRKQSGETIVKTGNPMRLLQQLVLEHHCPQYEGYPPLLGGCVGAFAYEAVQYVADVPLPGEDPTGSPDLHFMFFDRLCVYDHLKQQVIAVQLLRVPDGEKHAELRLLYDKTRQQLDEWVAQLRQGQKSTALPSALRDEAACGKFAFRSNMTKGQFINRVERAKALILEGAADQIVLSQRWEAEVTADPFDVYRVLRTMNPSPYMYFLQFNDETIAGASPEVLVKVMNGLVETRPIAGTRKRGENEEENNRLAAELLRDEKERAEHMMLVNAGKKEIARVSEEGTVRLRQFMDIEHYSHVMHMVSHVTGQLKEELHPLDALTACFPAGTVSGAPKQRALPIITELEREQRGIYAGGIGYIGFSGNMDTCIAIRTIVFKGSTAFIQAGAGIVADSVPEDEYEESLNKARALLSALARAEAMFQPLAETAERR